MIAGNRSVQRMTGRYARCRRVGRSSSSLLVGGALPAPCAIASGDGAFRNQYASTGTIVSATNSDAASAIVTVRANGRKSSPVMSLTRASGRKTATVVTVEAVTASATSRTPVLMASSFSSPRPRCRLMFSMTTIESSTTRPIAIVSAPSVMTLSE